MPGDIDAKKSRKTFHKPSKICCYLFLLFFPVLFSSLSFPSYTFVLFSQFFVFVFSLFIYFISLIVFFSDLLSFLFSFLINIDDMCNLCPQKIFSPKALQKLKKLCFHDLATILGNTCTSFFS